MVGWVIIKRYTLLKLILLFDCKIAHIFSFSTWLKLQFFFLCKIYRAWASMTLHFWLISSSSSRRYVGPNTLSRLSCFRLLRSLLIWVQHQNYSPPTILHTWLMSSSSRRCVGPNTLSRLLRSRLLCSLLIWVQHQHYSPTETWSSRSVLEPSSSPMPRSQ